MRDQTPVASQRNGPIRVQSRPEVANLAPDPGFRVNPWTNIGDLIGRLFTIHEGVTRLARLASDKVDCIGAEDHSTAIGSLRPLQALAIR